MSGWSSRLWKIEKLLLVKSVVGIPRDTGKLYSVEEVTGLLAVSTLSWRERRAFLNRRRMAEQGSRPNQHA